MAHLIAFALAIRPLLNDMFEIENRIEQGVAPYVAQGAPSENADVQQEKI